MPYLTPETLPSGTICRTVLIPDDIEWITIVNGALSRLIHASNFEQFGSITPEETAERFQQMFFEFRDSECQPVTPIGAIMMFGSTSPPDGWLNCDGALISRATYADLFAIIGTSYDVGDGTTTFGVPDFTNRSPMGLGGAIVPGLADYAGEATTLLLSTQLPAHTHPITDPGHTHPPLSPSSQFWGVGTGTGAMPGGSASRAAATTGSATTGITVNNNTGGGNPHPNVHPVVGAQFIIYAGV